MVGDRDPRRRVVSQFDARSGRYTGRTRTYRVDTDANLVADAQMAEPGRLLVLERDDLDGARAVTKRIYRVDLRHVDPDGARPKSLVADLLEIGNAGRIGSGDGWGTGDPFSFGLRSVDALVPLTNGNIVIINDDGYPGDAARRPGTPDDT